MDDEYTWQVSAIQEQLNKKLWIIIYSGNQNTLKVDTVEIMSN